MLVLGDMMVDEHAIGPVRSIAREAPVPVVEQEVRRRVPGGATNVAMNLRAMGCEVMVAGVVGADATADDLREQLKAHGIQTVGLMHDAGRKTSVKLRVWAGGDRQRPQHMIARVDMVDREPLGPDVEKHLLAYLETALPQSQALLVSDYENGVVGDTILRAALPAARAHALTITVDAHGGLGRFRDVTLVTPNQPEAESELGRELYSIADARAAARELRQRLRAEAVLMTLGEAGMVLAADDAAPAWLPVDDSTRVADPTGAGDTVAAAMTLGILGGGTYLEAARLAHFGARVVVQRLGAAVASAEELVAESDGPRG